MTRATGRMAWALSVAVFAALALAGANSTGVAEPAEKTWNIPVVMEQATMRGRVLILENRREERRPAKALPVKIWSDPAPAQNPARPAQLLHQTTTDDTGFFNLPTLEIGEYRLLVGDLRLRLTVTPRAEQRKDQDEPKTLLILIPRGVIRE